MEEKDLKEITDNELINQSNRKKPNKITDFLLKSDDSDHEYIEKERKTMKMTEEEKEKIAKAQKKDQYKEEKMLKKGL